MAEPTIPSKCPDCDELIKYAPRGHIPGTKREDDYVNNPVWYCPQCKRRFEVRG